MGVPSKLKKIFLKEQGLEKDQLDRLRQLPKDERNAEFGSIFHDRCIKAAVGFVQREPALQDNNCGGFDG